MLTEPASEPVAAPAATGSRRSPYLYPLIGLVPCSAGSACLALTLVVQVRMYWTGVGPQCYLLALMLFVGELRAIPVPRGDDTTDQLTVSSTFATALVLIGPLSLALLVQAVAVAIGDRISGSAPGDALQHRPVPADALRHPDHLLPGHRPRPLQPQHALPTPGDIPAALLASAVYFCVNNGLVATAVAMDDGVPVLAVLGEDVRFQLATSSILLGLAPVAAHVGTFSVFMLPLLVLPILGVHSNARMSLRRQHEAMHDALTDLPNRELLRRRAQKALATGRRVAPGRGHAHRPGPLQGDQRHHGPPRR